MKEPADFEVEFFSVNQTISHFIAKFQNNGWTSETHRLEPVYDQAIWAHEDEEVTEAELAAQARRALASVNRTGYVLAVHAPGRLALVWSDFDIPREVDRNLKAKFGPSMRSTRPLIEGAPPPWWPRTGGVASPLVKIVEQVRKDGGMRLIARCTMCGSTTYFDAVPNHPALADINWGMMRRYMEEAFEGRTFDISALRDAERGEILSFTEQVLPQWREEMRHNDRCQHV